MKRCFLFLALSCLTLCCFSQKAEYTWKSTETTSIKLSKSVEQESLSACPTRRGCFWSPEAVDAAVSDFLNCMADKQDILVDPMSINYSTFHTGGMGDMWCWCYLCRDLPGDPIYPLTLKLPQEKPKPDIRY